MASKKITIDPNQFEKNNPEEKQPEKFDLQKAIVGALEYQSSFYSESEKAVQRRTLTNNPNRNNSYKGLYVPRENMLPYFIVKELAFNDDLIATILMTRGNMVSNFGQPQTNRHDVGYRVSYRENDVEKRLGPEKVVELKQKMIHAKNLLYNAGYTEGLKASEKITLPQFLKEIVRDGLLFGWLVIEKIRDGEGKLAYFRAADAGTIYRAPPRNPASRALMQQALTKLTADLEQNPQERMNLQSLQELANGNPDYKWVQVIDEVPRAAFTEDDLLVYPLYPSTEIENNSYPRPIIDSIVKAVSSHMNIATHNNLYFAYGRASKGMLVIKSDAITEVVMQRLRQQFYASINSVQSSFRAPLFNIGKDDNIQWVTLDGPRDGEMMNLDEQVSRTIMGAFGVSPDEIPALNNLGRPIPTQALAESKQEYRVTASRAIGFFPLLQSIQTVVNMLLKDFDEELAEHCVVKFVGLQSPSAQEEVTIAQMQSNLFLTANELRKQFEVDPIEIGGNIPLNPAMMNVINNNFPLNQILYAFTKDKSVLTDPTLMFYQNGHYFNHVQGIGKELLKSKGRISKALQDALEEIKELMDEGD